METQGTGVSTVIWRRLLPLAGAALLGGCGLEGDPSGPSAPAAVEIAAPSTFVELGQKLLLTARVRDASGRELRSAQVSWASSDPAVAEVADGLVTGRYPGSAYVRATAGAAVDSVRITVEGPPVGAIETWPDSLYLIRGRTAQLFVGVRDLKGRLMPHPVHFSSSDPAVATVSPTGEVQGIAPGAASVTVMAGLRSAQLHVRVVAGDRYSVRALGTLVQTGDPDVALSTARDISNRGEVVGEARTSTGLPAAVLWSRGKTTVLAPPPSGSRGTGATALNDSGTVVGYTLVNPDNTVYRSHPWIWRAGSLSSLPGLDPIQGMGISVADINNRGQVVGSTYGTYFKNTSGEGFIWDAGRLTWLPRLAVRTVPEAISDRGTLAVSGFDECVMCDPTFFKPGVRAYAGEHPAYTLVLLPDTAGMLWSASDVNEHGQVVGTYWRRDGAGDRGALLWEGGTLTQITSLPGAVAINRHGDIVGGAFLRRGGQTIDLNQAVASTTWEILGARGINDLGQIIAQGRNRSTGVVEALLLTPAQ